MKNLSYIQKVPSKMTVTILAVHIFGYTNKPLANINRIHDNTMLFRRLYVLFLTWKHTLNNIDGKFRPSEYNRGINRIAMINILINLWRGYVLVRTMISFSLRGIRYCYLIETIGWAVHSIYCTRYKCHCRIFLQLFRSNLENSLHKS